MHVCVCLGVLQAQLARVGFLSRNNELVVNLSSVVEALPHSIEAFFLTPEDTDYRVRQAHAAFVAYYGLRSFPLLKMDLAGGGARPFSLADAE